MNEEEKRILRDSKKLKIVDFVQFAYENIDEKDVDEIMIEWLEKSYPQVISE